MIPEIILVPTDMIPENEFHVKITKKPIDDQDILNIGQFLANTDLQFVGEDDLASAFVGGGLLEADIKKGKQCVIIYNGKTKPSFPNNIILK